MIPEFEKSTINGAFLNEKKIQTSDFSNLICIQLNFQNTPIQTVVSWLYTYKSAKTHLFQLKNNFAETGFSNTLHPVF